MSDIRHALRSLLRQPGPSLLIVLTLALAIGANTAVFSIVSGVLLRPLPYAAPDRIVIVQEQRPATGPSNNTPANYLDLRRRSHVFERLAATFGGVFDLEDRTERVRLDGAHVTADFFDVFGVAPIAGRTFGRADEGAGAPPRIVLSDGAWERHFSRDRAVIGRPVLLNGRAYIVDGVMPPTFDWPRGAEAWALAPTGLPPSPLEVEGDLASQRDLSYLDVIGRMKVGVSLDQARADANLVAQQLAREHPATNSGKSYVVRTLHEFTVGDVRATLMVLLGLVALVLLIACANIANLLVARAADRQREVAIRAAIGAGRAQVVRLFLTESLLLAAVGGGLALVVSFWSFDALKALIGEALPRTDQIAFDLRVAAFTAALSVLSAVLFGLAPLVHLGDGLHHALRGGSGRTVGSRGVRRLRQLLVAGEVALTVVVLAAAGLMANSLWRLTSTDAGIRTDGVIAQSVPLTRDRYPDLARQSQFYGRVLEELRRRPAIAAAAIGFPIPLAGNNASASFDLEGHPERDDDDRPRAQLNIASPGFFDALGIPVLRGRDFTEQDRVGAPPVALVNRAFVERFFPGVDPIGRRLIFDRASDDSQFTIVGIVSDYRREALERPPEPGLYLSYRQFSLPFLFVIARAADGSVDAGASVQEAVGSIDPRIVLGSARTLDDLRYRAAATPRLRTILLGTFAGLAVLLAWLGIYGILSHSVVQRTPELGVRMAIGAGTRDVYALVLGEGVRLAAIGLITGLLLALGGARVLQGLLYGVSPRDVPTFALVAVTLLVLAAAASYLPARRATRIDPIEALRWD